MSVATTEVIRVPTHQRVHVLFRRHPFMIMLIFCLFRAQIMFTMHISHLIYFMFSLVAMGTADLHHFLDKEPAMCDYNREF